MKVGWRGDGAKEEDEEEEKGEEGEEKVFSPPLCQGAIATTFAAIGTWHRE